MNQATSFGGFVRQRRREMDLTQDELARRVGCAAITLRKIEADDLRASVQIAERLAMALAIPLEDRAEFIRWARAVRPASSDLTAVTPPPSLEEIGRDDLTGRAIRGYALSERIGMGGMGSVYRAVQPNVEREVAIKIILPAFANHPDFIRRFEAEAQLVARLEHPHIVPLYDYWREPGVAYLVMRLLRGGNTQDLLKQGPLSIETTAHILEQICSALNTAHRIGVIHRDLKPANVLLDEDSNAYLGDFGIAKNLGNPDFENQTHVDAMIGSPQYMSPEQIRSLSIRPQTDIYCLGVMLYEMLTGTLPFSGPTPFDLIQQHINTPMPPLSARRSGLPAALDAIITRATAKDPDDRFPDVLSLFKEFRRAIGSMIDSHPVTIHYEEEDSEAEILNPFKGLRAFAEADAENFFGRETLIQQLLARLGEGGDLSRFLAVIGPSGSGKSSVVRAGLIPALRRGGLPGSENWFMVDMLPGKHPFEELEAALLRVAVNPPESLLSQLKDGNRGLLRAVHRILPADDSVELVLVIDQFEEVFTLVEDEAERALLLESLATAVMDERSRLRVVITLRADFTDKPLRYMDFGEMMNRRFEFVLPLTADEVERAVAGPAQRAGLRLEKGLVSTIIREAGNQPGTLPLLQFALSELFENRDGRSLTNRAYREIGGVLGALGRSAQSIYSGLEQAGQSATRQLFLRLVTLGEGTEDTRRRVLREELENLATQDWLSEIIDLFGNARLLTFDHDPITRGATIEVAHEALLREWARLREWLNESRADVRLQRQLTAAANEWRNAGQDPSFLLTGARLEQFEGWVGNTTVALTQDERAYLDTSLTERDQRALEERARQERELENLQKLAESERQRAEEQTGFAKQLSKRAMYLTGAFIIALIMAFTALFFGSQARNTAVTAQNERRVATARELAAASFNNLAVDPERSLLLALQSVATTREVDGTVLPESVEALHNSIVASPIRMTLRGHETRVFSAAFSPDGKQLATIGDDGTTILWDADTGRELLRLPGTTIPSDLFTEQRIAYSPDGKLLATCDSNQLKVYDPVSGKLLMTLSGHEGDVISVTFSFDGKYLATGSVDTTVRIWDVGSGELLHALNGHSAEVGGLAFSPEGRLLFTSSEDGMLIIWDVATGELLRTLPGFTIYKVSFSPDGTRVAAATFNGLQLWRYMPDSAELISLEESQAILTIPDGSAGIFSPDGEWLATLSLSTANTNAIKLWDANTGQELLTLAGHTDWLAGFAFSPDGERLVSTSLDGTVRIWSLAPGQETVTVSGPLADYGTRVVYNPNGQEFATNGGDGTATIWNGKTGEPRLILKGHDLGVLSVAFSPDGKRFATGSLDATAILWDTATGQKLLRLSGHEDGVRDITFSPDGTLIATGSFDLTARVWDAVTGKQLKVFTDYEGIVLGVAFSPNGTHLATSSTDGTAKIWDVGTGKLSLTFAGGGPDIAYSPDGKKIATASSDATAKIWDAATGKELLTLTGHSSELRPVAFSPDGKFLATGSGDNTAKIWDVATGQELLTLPGSEGGVYGVAFSPLDGGSQLAVASNDGVVRVFLLRIDELLALAETRVTRSLTTAECKKYLHVEQCPSEP